MPYAQGLVIMNYVYICSNLKECVRIRFDACSQGILSVRLKGNKTLHTGKLVKSSSFRAAMQERGQYGFRRKVLPAPGK